MASNLSKKELIISSFEKMDIEMLEVLLNDDQTYQDARKDAFIEKLKEAFNTFKTVNDTSLQAFRGICVSSECSNSGCSGYSFWGSNSKNHLDLIFEETELDFKDIYVCSDLKTNKTVDKINRIRFDIFHDDKPRFNPSIETLAKIQLCEKAYIELVNNETVYLDKNDYLYWIVKHKTLFSTLSIFSNISQIDKFYWLYYRLKNYAVFLENDADALFAINEFNLLDLNNEKQLLEWLVKNESLANSLTLFQDLDYLDDEKLKTGYFLLSSDYKLQLAISDFDTVYQFKKLHDNYYWDFLEKYTTFSNEELNNRNDNKLVLEYSNVLSYHLKKRGLI